MFRTREEKKRGKVTETHRERERDEAAILQPARKRSA